MTEPVKTIELSDPALDAQSGGPRMLVTYGASLRDVERALIEITIRGSRGNKKDAARILGISRSALYAKLHRFGLLPEPCAVCGGEGHGAGDHGPDGAIAPKPEPAPSTAPEAPAA